MNGVPEEYKNCPQKGRSTIYIVGIRDCESNEIKTLHWTYEGALESWNILREELIKNNEKMLSYDWVRSSEKNNPTYSIMILNLQCKDPDKIDNYPHETPYIEEKEVED